MLKGGVDYNYNLWSGGLRFGSVHISGIFTEGAFTFVGFVRSQRKHMYVLTDTHVKHSCFLEWQEVPEIRTPLHPFVLFVYEIHWATFPVCVFVKNIVSELYFVLLWYIFIL